LNALARTDMIKIFLPWTSLIALQMTCLDAAVGFVTDLGIRMAKVKVKLMTGDDFCDREINEQMDGEALGWHGKDGQDKYLVICEYADEWIKNAGYRIRLAYLWLPRVRISLERVRQRHLKGGHNVPSGDVRRRFVPSLVNFFRRYLPLADEALLFDAAAYPPQLIARWAGGKKDVIDVRTYEAVLRQAKV
jgi:hypothetical protein